MNKPALIDALIIGFFTVLLGTIGPFLWQAIFDVLIINLVWQFWNGLGWFVTDLFVNNAGTFPFGFVNFFLWPLAATGALSWGCYRLRKRERLKRTTLIMVFVLLSLPFQIDDPNVNPAELHYSYISYACASL
jgi:hypothetical protein